MASLEKECLERSNKKSYNTFSFKSLFEMSQDKFLGVSLAHEGGGEKEEN